MATYEDSHLRCPYDHKLMMVEIGQDDEGRLDAIHECWHCDYMCRALYVPVVNAKRIHTGRRAS